MIFFGWGEFDTGAIKGPILPASDNRWLIMRCH